MFVYTSEMVTLNSQKKKKKDQITILFFFKCFSIKILEVEKWCLWPVILTHYYLGCYYLMLT